MFVCLSIRLLHDFRSVFLAYILHTEKNANFQIDIKLIGFMDFNLNLINLCV